MYSLGIFFRISEPKRRSRIFSSFQDPSESWKEMTSLISILFFISNFVLLAIAFSFYFSLILTYFTSFLLSVSFPFYFFANTGVLFFIFIYDLKPKSKSYSYSSSLSEMWRVTAFFFTMAFYFFSSLTIAVLIFLGSTVLDDDGLHAFDFIVLSDYLMHDYGKIHFFDFVIFAGYLKEHIFFDDDFIQYIIFLFGFLSSWHYSDSIKIFLWPTLLIYWYFPSTSSF